MDAPQHPTDTDWREIVSQLLTLSCISIMSTLFGVKIAGGRLREVTYPRALVLLLYLLSWAFTTISSILLSTNDGNSLSCDISMLTCDIFYAGTKIVIYLWLIERVWVVTEAKTTRLDTFLYRFHLFLLTPYIGISVLMILYRVSYIESNGECTIGLLPVASIPLVVYDFIFNLYITTLFVRPIINVGRNVAREWSQSRLYGLARRSLIAAAVCLIISTVNILIMIFMRGHERSLFCLPFCSIDVTLNVGTIHWVTSVSIPLNVSKDIFSSTGLGTNVADSSEPDKHDISVEGDMLRNDSQLEIVQMVNIKG